MKTIPISSRASDLTPDQRRQTVAKILARAVLRYQRLGRNSASSEKSGEVRAPSLEVPGETRLSVFRRTGGYWLRGESCPTADVVAKIALPRWIGTDRNGAVTTSTGSLIG